MSSSLATQIVRDFESGRISRRELAARLMGLGAAMATFGEAAFAEQAAEKQPAGQRAEPTFTATGLHHIALDVTDIPRSRDFYAKQLGLKVIRGDDNALFMGQGRDFFLTLFRRERAGLNHYSYAVPRLEPDAAFEKLAAAGLRPRREGQRIYFPDPDGMTVQISQQRTA